MSHDFAFGTQIKTISGLSQIVAWRPWGSSASGAPGPSRLTLARLHLPTHARAHPRASLRLIPDVDASPVAQAMYSVVPLAERPTN